MGLVVVVASVIALADVAVAGCKTATTFNTALTTRVGNYYGRRGLIADALASESADILCLQEMWYEDDMRKLKNALQSIYPHHYSGIHEGINNLGSDSWKWWGAKSACSLSHTWNLIYHVLPCARREGCLSVFSSSSEAGLGCLAQKCPDELGNDGISPSCLSCLVLSSSSVSDIWDRCYKWSGQDQRFNPSGLMVFSKTPLPAQPTTHYRSYFEGQGQVLHRGYIQTEAQDIGKFVCTHYTSVFPTYWEYDLSYGSYETQQQVELNLTHARLGNSNHIVAADFNTGGEVSSSDPEKNLQAEVPDSYALLQHQGYDTETYVSDDGRCTYCEDNDLVSGYNVAIDDVLVMGDAFTSVTKQRVLDQKNPPLSDHFGVRARLCNN